MGSIICYMRYSRVGFPLADPDNGGTPPPNRKKRAGAASERADKLAEEPPKGRKRSVVRLVATLGMAGAGMLCKEQAVTALGVCVAYELLCVPYNAKVRGTCPNPARRAVLCNIPAGYFDLDRVMRVPFRSVCIERAQLSRCVGFWVFAFVTVLNSTFDSAHIATEGSLCS